MKRTLFEHLKEMLLISQTALRSKGRFRKEVGSVNTKGDISIGMDIEIERLLVDYVKKNSLPVDVFSEEKGIIKVHSAPQYLLVFDPLDGSTNYKLGKGLLPFGVLIAIYKGIHPSIRDVSIAGAAEYTSRSGWIYDGNKTIDFKGKQIRISRNWKINQSAPVYLDLYYKKAYQKFLPLAEKVHIRWSGSNIGSLLYVLNGNAAVMGAMLMRPEEIGVMYALIRGAGGVVVDHENKDLGAREFSPQKTYPILAGSKKVVEFMTDILKK